MNAQRYNTDDTIDALKMLGFNVRNPDGATTIFCIHTITQEEVWIPKTDQGFLRDVLEAIFEPIKLRFEFFHSVYMNTPHKRNPSDQY